MATLGNAVPASGSTLDETKVAEAFPVTIRSPPPATGSRARCSRWVS
ncbi:hypothetical protein [Lentzea sp. CC55]|nr:hypothetical protein [Lentzea sp. CC55]MCG8922831.1 hypothetical protein [Lentzea sp. CC55]